MLNIIPFQQSLIKILIHDKIIPSWDITERVTEVHLISDISVNIDPPLEKSSSCKEARPPRHQGDRYGQPTRYERGLLNKSMYQAHEPVRGDPGIGLKGRRQEREIP